MPKRGAKAQQEQLPKRIRSEPKKPALCGLKGSFVLSTYLRSSWSIPIGILPNAAKNWGNMNNVLDGYFKEVTRPLSADGFYNQLVETFNTIIANTKNVSLKTYVQRLQAFYGKESIRQEMKGRYSIKREEAAIVRAKQAAVNAGELTGAILSQRGAENLREEVSQLNETRNQSITRQSHDEKEYEAREIDNEHAEGDNGTTEIENEQEDEENEKDHTSYQVVLNEVASTNNSNCLLVPLTPPVLATTKGINIGCYPSSSSELAQKFHQFKLAVLDGDEKEDLLSYESNLHEILSLTHILLLKQNHINLQKQIIGDNLMNKTYNDFVEKYPSIDYEDENSEFMKNVKKLIKPLKFAGFNRDAVVKNIVMEMLKHQLGSFEYSILRALQNIIEEFPHEPLNDIKEHDVIHGIVDPIIRPILSSCKYRLRWPEISADARLCRTTRSQRPDAMLSEVDGLAYAICYGYGEVKAKNTDKYGKQVDLARLAIVGKDTIDIHKHNHVLLFQVVGNTITFYLEYLAAEATYVVARLNRVNLPRSISEIAAFTIAIPLLYHVYTAFKTSKTTMTHEYWIENHRETLDTPSFRTVIDKSRLNSRPCFIHHEN